jgi:hypothetical protein
VLSAFLHASAWVMRILHELLLLLLQNCCCCCCRMLCSFLLQLLCGVDRYKTGCMLCCCCTSSPSAGADKKQKARDILQAAMNEATDDQASELIDLLLDIDDLPDASFDGFPIPVQRQVRYQVEVITKWVERKMLKQPAGRLVQTTS